MEIRSVTLHWRRITLAALRLAALYAVAVSILIVAHYIALNDRPMASDLPYFGTPLLVAFVVLAVARRAGFALLWTLLAALWVYAMSVDAFLGSSFPSLFLSWSVFSAPLFAMGALGVPTRHAGAPSRRRIPSPFAVTWVWGLLAGVALYLRYAPIVSLRFPQSEYLLNALGWIFWFPAPFAIAMLEVSRVWRGTSPVGAEAPAA